MVTRRALLRGAAIGVAGAAAYPLVGCGDDAAPRPSPSPGTGTPTATLAPPTATASPTATATQGPPDWSQLAKSISGKLVLPGDASYAQSVRLFNPRFDGLRPQAIAYCASAKDVAQCVTFARKAGVTPAARSGGHSYGGYSSGSGLVIDLGGLNTLSVSASGATIGAGGRLIDVYAACAAQGVAIPAGSCATVGISGLALGGGIGFLGRKLGLTCDNLRACEVVTADGETLQCDASKNEDLYWACRGGGGGSFGVATSFVFDVHPLQSVTLFSLDWPWAMAAEVVAAWQEWAPSQPDELTSNCLLVATGVKTAGAKPLISVNGIYAGAPGPLAPLLDALVARAGPPSDRSARAVAYLDAMKVEAGCGSKTVEQCRLPSQGAQGQLQRESSHAKSDFYTKAIPAAGIKTLISGIEARQADAALSSGGVGLDALGGAVNRVAADATAFVHRDSLFDAQYSGSWTTGGADVDAANLKQVTALWEAMRPYASGQGYVNYIDPQLANWQQAYFGANYPRLQAVKKKYDPENVFRTAQTVTA